MGGVHAGPESRVLEGVSWDEARQMQDAQPSSLGNHSYIFFFSTIIIYFFIHVYFSPSYNLLYKASYFSKI